MYKKVETSQDQEKFEKIWGLIAEEEGFELMPIYNKSDKYLILHEDGSAIGTLEFLKYNPKVFSNMEYYFPFSEQKIVQEHMDSIIYESSKVSILKEYRNPVQIKKILLLISNYIKENKVEFFLASLRPELYLVFRKRYKIEMEVLGKIKNAVHGVTPVPLFVNALQMRETIEKRFNSF